ncbi:universal stress protein [Phenylobacterium montanum]|uniref:Universal stress protein n=1 Tax=Phenylobacterium montanum TaxID=2823693 RepID=A0A975G2V3_9CAUL|nr:universal stress protein [Caulobacter sp. S6]QUD89542.1 universal stress protein [Caulobacter sp. S6]
MFKHIMIAVDGGDPAVRAAETGMALARSLGAEVALFHAFEPHALEVQAGVPINDLTVEAEREAASLFETLLPTSAEAGQISRFTEIGAAAPSIIAAARRWDADLIVIGSHGRDGVMRAVLGSVAETVMRQAHCPVLVVKAREEASN